MPSFLSHDIILTPTVFGLANASQKHKLQPVWLADPSNIQLIESNVALDAEAAQLKVGLGILCSARPTAMPSNALQRTLLFKPCIVIRLQAEQDTYLSAGREVPAELENKLQAIAKKMADLGANRKSFSWPRCGSIDVYTDACAWLVCVADKFKASGDQAKTMRQYHRLLQSASARDQKLLTALGQVGSAEGVKIVQQRLQ
eukprot:COSAG02_NODE_14876_length_1227_cov_1.444149_1_plen_201_part_00